MTTADVQAIARELSLDCVGVCSAHPQEELAQLLHARRARYGKSAFEPADIPERVTPPLHFADARSIIVALFPYYRSDVPAGNLSRYAQLPDYHAIVRNLLNRLCDALRQKQPSFRAAVYCDNGPLSDRWLAYQAGLGFFGWNNCLIHPKYGSYCFIGYLITNLALTPSQPMRRECNGCGNCLSACPGNALSPDYGFAPSRCLSELTQQKEASPEQLETILHSGCLWGCDVCQQVCPHNQAAAETPISAFREAAALPSLDIAEIQAMSNREFRRRYGAYPFAWRGKAPFNKYHPTHK